MASEGTTDPFNGTALVDDCALSVQVVHVFRPVFDSRITQFRALTHKKLYGASVEVGNVVFGCTASFDKVQIGIVFNNDKSVLKLARTLGIQTKIALQRKIKFCSLGYIYKTATRPHSAMQSGEFMIGWRDKRHELLMNKRFPFWLFKSLFDPRIHNTHFGSGVLHVVVHQLGIVLGTNAR